MEVMEVESRFSELLIRRMDELNLSIRDVSDRMGVTYEHIRRCVRGITSPSKYLARELCKVLDLDQNQVNEALAADGIQRRYGQMPAILAHKNPEMAPFERLWEQLTPEQRDGILVQMRALSQRNQVSRNSM